MNINFLLYHILIYCHFQHTATLKVSPKTAMIIGAILAFYGICNHFSSNGIPVVSTTYESHGFIKLGYNFSSDCVANEKDG